MSMALIHKLNKLISPRPLLLPPRVNYCCVKIFLNNNAMTKK